MNKRLVLLSAFVFSASFVSVLLAQVASSPITLEVKKASLSLPPGFSASIVVEGVDGARHMAFNKKGGLYIKLSKLKDGKGILYLKDTNGDGKFDEQRSFGNYPGTGIFIKDN